MAQANRSPIHPASCHLPWFESLAGHERYERLVARAGEGRERAARAFREAGGDKLLAFAGGGS